MPIKDKLDLSNKNILDVVVDKRRYFVVIILVITAWFAFTALQLETDPSLKSGMDFTTDAYKLHQRYGQIFGSEEFLLVALKHERGAKDPAFLSSIVKISRALSELRYVVEVVSLPEIHIFQKRNEKYWTYPVLMFRDGVPQLPDDLDLKNIRKALPVTDFLLSNDLKTFGILVRMQEEYKFDPAAVTSLLEGIEGIVRNAIPAGTEFRIIGAPIVRQGIVHYSIQTGIYFGTLCLIIATIVSVYIFKSARVTAVTNVILLICVVWVLGLMAALRIPLNSTTALAFGFIPITTLEIVIHMVIRYHLFHEATRDKIGAIKQAVRWLARPCFICSATTAVGFGTLMIGSIPMVRQLGFIMSVGIMTSYFLAMTLTPAFFIRMKSLDAPSDSAVVRDWLNVFLLKAEGIIFGHYKTIVAIGALLTLFLFAGAPMIRSDIQLLRMLSESTKEIQDIKFVEANLTPVNSLEILLEAEPNAFKKPDVWKKIQELETRLKELPEVASTDSLLPFLDYLYQLLVPGRAEHDALFKNPKMVPQLLTLLSLSQEGNRVLRRFVNDDYDHLRISVRIKNSPTVPLTQTIEELDHTAKSVMKGTARASVTGDLAVFSAQTSHLIRDQILSMGIACVLITLLMMLQMGSPTLGLVCLIPNIPPMAAVFGLMGWFGISLDGVTVFAATVAIGLAVDNTIHYLTQLKRNIKMNPNQSIEESVRQAYRSTVRQILSWASVLIMGFLALSISPFRPVVLFGVLGCFSLIFGLFGDMFFIQSLVLWSSTVRNSIKKLVAKEIAQEQPDRA